MKKWTQNFVNYKVISNQYIRLYDKFIEDFFF